MEKVGVEAVVEGLVSFLGDMKKVDKSITDLVPSNSLLSQAFQAVGNVVEWLTGSVFRVLEYTLGNLIASAIQAVVREIRELIAGTIEAGQEFQTLQLRLQNFNLNAAVDSGMEFSEAMKVATEQTQEQLEWLQKLAATTPYDLTDIANVYTLARSYGFASAEAETLTARIADFAAGMSLGNTEIERIVVNFGQMVQQGKVTQREMNDLARGAFVPVNDVLKLMQEQTGLTGKAFDDFRNSGEGVNAFMTAFNTLVEQRFTGATTAMARTWKGATDNVKDFIKSIVGLDIVKPVLDTLGGYVANFLDAFTKVPNEFENVVNEMEGVRIRDPFEEIVATARTIGRTISEIITEILGLGPSADELALKLSDGLGGFSDWLVEHKDDIVTWVKNAIDKVQEFADKVKSFIDEKVVPAFDRISDWVNENKGTIDEFFSTVGSIVSEFFSDLTGQPGKPEGGGGDILGSLLQGLTDFMNFVIENRDAILQWVEIIWSVIAVFTVLGTIAKIVVGILISLAGIVLSIISAWGFLQGVMTVVGTVFGVVSGIITAIGLPILALIALVIALAVIWSQNSEQIKTTVSQLWFIIQYYSAQIVKWVNEKFTEMWEAVKEAVENAKNTVMENFDSMVTIVTEKVDAIKTAAADKFTEMKEAISEKLVEAKDTITTKFTEAKDAILSLDWVGTGVQMVAGIVSGVLGQIPELVAALVEAAQAALAAVTGVLQIQSPSKVMYGIGKNMMIGMANGIAESAGLVTKAMQGVAMASMAAPVIGGTYSRNAPVTNSSQISNTNNYNLQINSSAAVEPIVSDFNMLQSLNS